MATKKQSEAARANLEKARAAKNQKPANMESFKMEVANEVGVNLNQGANLTTQQAGKVGGQMVKKMVESYGGSNKMEVANEVGVDLNQGGNLTTHEAGRVGGQMVKKMVESYENGSK